MGCLDEDTIVQFVEGGLSASEMSDAEAHLDACINCRQLVSEMAKAFSANPVDSATSKSARPIDQPTEKISMAEIKASTSSSSSISSRPQPLAQVTQKISIKVAPSASSAPVIATDGSRISAMMPGELLAGRYQIIRWLGSGGMGAVYEVQDQQLGERVALKLLRPELKNVPHLLEQMHHEIVLGRRITHPNACRLHDIGTAGDTHFITMELIEGESLDIYLAQQTPTAEKVVSILVDVCRALEAAHAVGVVHRDLKPANLMFDLEGKVVVMDFGLARDIRGGKSLSGMLVGSPAYWSPEQAAGKRATPSSDIYSLGVVACELFGVGRPTMGGDKRLAHLPLRYRAIIQRCLKVDADQRFESVRSLRLALQSASQAGRSRRLAWGITIALALVAGASLAVLFVPQFGGSSESTEAVVDTDAGGAAVVDTVDAALPKTDGA